MGTPPLLVVLAGLPGSGKSKVASGLARELRAAVVSVDPIEQALRQSGLSDREEIGLVAYVTAQALAAENLRVGTPVVADAVNAVEVAREGWRRAAASAGSRCLFVEVRCSDPTVHRQRLQARGRRFADIAEPTWADVESLAASFEDWQDDHFSVDTADDKDAIAAISEWLSGRSAMPT